MYFWIVSATQSALLALLLLTVFAALGFGWRSWAQYRATGSTGYRGVSGTPGSIEWFAGIGFILAVVTAVAAPVLQIIGVIAPLGSPPWLTYTGIGLAAAGIAATVHAQVAMGRSWRIGVDHDEVTTLVRTGVFGHVRNPIFSAMLLFGVGLTLVAPNPVAMAGFALLVASIQAQVRFVEEPYLAAVHGEEYLAYTAAVGRFVPGIGLTRRHPARRER